MSATRTVLVADDNEANRLLAKSALEDEGYAVVTASSGSEAVAIFEGSAPDCVLLDVRMQQGDGFEACERIRALPAGADTPIIFITALRDVDTFDRARRVGGDDFLTKPVRPDELVMRVTTALALKQRRSELDDALKKQRDDLVRAQLQKERLAAFIVHDLKNPVNAMDLHAQLLLRDTSLSPAALRSAQQIRAEARQLNRMILNLLDVSKGDEGKLAATLVDVDLDALLATVAAELGPAAAALKTAIVIGPTTLHLTADFDLLQRTLTNLVENAIRHSGSGSTVRVSATETSRHVEIRVADAGPGVPVDKRSSIFDPFVQLDGTTPPTRAGRGLGLAFCKLATETQGGSIAIEDGSPGAIFCVRLRR